MAYELNYKGFEENLVEVKNPDIWGKATYKFEFENSYGANVSVCYETRFRTLWSLAGTKVDEFGNKRICWNIPGVMGDIEIYLTDKDVQKLLEMIKGL